MLNLLPPKVDYLSEMEDPRLQRPVLSREEIEQQLKRANELYWMRAHNLTPGEFSRLQEEFRQKEKEGKK